MTIPVNPNIDAFYYGSMFRSKSYILISRPFVPMPKDNPFPFVPMPNDNPFQPSLRN